MNKRLALNSIKKVGLVATMVLCIVGCTQNNTGKTEVKDEGVDSVQVPAPKVVRQSIPFSGLFSQVNNMGSIDVEYSVGHHSIVAEGPEELVKLVKATVDSGTLALSFSYDNNPDINVFKRKGISVKVYVTAPSLRIVSTCGTGSFHASGKFETDEFMAGTLASGDILIDTLVCHGPFRYESKNDGEGKFRCLVTEQQTDFVNEGTGNITVDSLCAKYSVLVNHNGKSVTTLHGSVPTLEVWGFEQGKINIDMDVDNLTLKAFDQSTIEYMGTYKTKTLKQDKKAHIAIQ